MKTTFVIVAMMSLALVGCGKKDSKKSGNAGFYSNFASTQSALVIIPQQSGIANNTPPQIQVGNLTYTMSYSSSYEARMAVQQMYNGTGGYRLHSQDAQSRRFVARVVGTCQNGLGYGNYGNQFQQYNQYPGQPYNQQYPNQFQQNTVCQSGSQIVVQQILP